VYLVFESERTQIYLNIIEEAMGQHARLARDAEPE
jgi:hypothetical protein